MVVYEFLSVCAVMLDIIMKGKKHEHYSVGVFFSGSIYRLVNTAANSSCLDHSVHTKIIFVLFCGPLKSPF
jgi:hypothetical protein